MESAANLSALPGSFRAVNDLRGLLAFLSQAKSRRTIPVPRYCEHPGCFNPNTLRSRTTHNAKPWCSEHTHLHGHGAVAAAGLAKLEAELDAIEKSGCPSSVDPDGLAIGEVLARLFEVEGPMTTEKLARLTLLTQRATWAIVRFLARDGRVEILRRRGGWRKRAHGGRDGRGHRVRLVRVGACAEAKV